MKDKTKDWNIGFLIGELIVEKYLPSLHGLECYTNQSVVVSDEDAKRYSELEDVWYSEHCKKDNKKRSDELWVEYREFAISLYQKYLPEVLKCHIPIIDNVNIEEVKSGIRVALWDSDRCVYNISTNNDIIIEKDKYSKTYSVIKLNLDIEGHKKDLYDKYKKK